MISFIAKRLAQSVLVMAIVSASQLFAVQLCRRSGQQYGGPGRDTRTAGGNSRKLGLDDPILTQYTRFIGNVCRPISV